MAKVITFSRTFPAYHPKSGQPTYFIEKFWESVGLPDKEYSFNLPDEYQSFMRQDGEIVWAKHHTIRNGNRWKVGDKFSPRVWGDNINTKSGRKGAYHSDQITIAPDILITSVYDFEIETAYKQLPLDYDTDIIINHRFYHTDSEIMKQIAINDGLSLAELLQWFKYPKPFKGQIICWNENVNY